MELLSNNFPITHPNLIASHFKVTLKCFECKFELLSKVVDYLEKNRAVKDEHGHSLAVRNGSLPEREILTGLGPIKVKQSRVDDRKLRQAKAGDGFSSQILPRYLRRIPSLDNLIPALYLRGISSGDFPRALSAILGQNAANLSATTVVRLKAKWQEDYELWRQQDLSKKEYV